MEQKIFNVSEVNQYLKSLLDSDRLLAGLTVRGEISNYKVYPSGHHYFSLKDSGGAIRCVMFRGPASALRFRPENGMQVLATGRVTVFPRDGAYQLYCERLTPEGVGDLYVAFEQLKEKLYKEGLFDPAHKLPLPVFPKRIAIVTSAAGAAIHDMLRILGKRYPLTKVILLPVRVQGAEAPAEIAGAIRYVNRHQIADLIITGRGGGSMEDLWAFNDERVARMIYLSQIPVISAVGHEPDVTISDFVADLRAATPSNAAELAVPDQGELRERISGLLSRLHQAETKRLKLWRQQADRLRDARVLQSPKNYLEDRRVLLDHQLSRLESAVKQQLLRKNQGYVRARTALEAMSPLLVLGRGYSMTRDRQGRVLTDAAAVKPGDQLTISLRRGQVEAQVLRTEGGSDGTGTEEHDL